MNDHDHTRHLDRRWCRHCNREIYLLELGPGLPSEWRHIGSNTVHCHGHRHDAEPKDTP